MSGRSARARPLAPRARRRPRVLAFVQRRLGPGPGTAQLRNWVVRSFGARSFHEFWRYWNPLYSYVLLYFVYQPLRRWMPHLLAVWLTFVVCGFVLHDLVGWTLARRVRFPEMTLMFVLFGAGAVLSERTRMNLARWPLAARMVVNVACLLFCWRVSALVAASVAG
jgi:hypothetical protein